MIIPGNSQKDTCDIICRYTLPQVEWLTKESLSVWRVPQIAVPFDLNVQLFPGDIPYPALNYHLPSSWKDSVKECHARKTPVKKTPSIEMKVILQKRKIIRD